MKGQRETRASVAGIACCSAAR
eukprot:COSAG03_NODE_28515_length_197_cov_219.229730_1_plen_21_part_10